MRLCLGHARHQHQHAERGHDNSHLNPFRITSFSPDQVSSTAATLTSTRPVGSRISRMTSSVMSVGTLLAFFGQEIQIAPSRVMEGMKDLADFSSWAREAV